MPLAENRGRSEARISPPIEGGSDDESSTTVDLTTAENSPIYIGRRRKLAGHPCAAGCGHYCWAANEDSDEV